MSKFVIECPVCGRYAEAKREWELIAETLATEYGMTEDDNDMQWPRHEIAQLETLLKEHP